MHEWLAIPAFFFIWGIIKLYKQEGFFVPLPMGTVRAMLKLAKIKEGDILYDLGSGDGRTVIEAAKKHGASAVGIEIGYLAHAIATLNTKIKNPGKVRLIRNDFFKENIGDATVVMFYLTPKLNRMLKPKLKKELKRGTRIVSASHEIPGWTPAKKIKTGHFWTYLYKI